MRKLALFAAAVLGGIVLLLLVAGLVTPAEHTAATQARFAVPPEEVWTVIADLGHWASWNGAIQEMRPGPPQEGHPAWIAVGEWDEMPMVVDVAEPGRRLVTRIPDDAGLGFSGSWSYELRPEGEGTVVTITERGRVSNPLFRLLVHFGDPHASATAFLRDLGKRLGRTVEPVPVLAPHEVP